MSVPERDERPHQPTAEPLWSESWYFDFAAADASVGGYVRLGRYPNLDVAWYWAYLTGEHRRLIVVRDHAVDLPRGQSLEVRSEGLWSALNCETPLEHWSIGLEAGAVALDDPVESYAGERGDPVSLGLDLEWEAVSPAFPYTGVTRYEQSCRVHGEILVGDERLAFDGPGQRDHSWGVRDWWAFPWCWTSGALSDGAAFHAVNVGGRYRTGYVASSGRLEPVDGLTVETVLGEAGLPVSASMSIATMSIALTPVAHAPVLLEAPDGRQSRFPRALCRYRLSDGRSGVGWTEWLQPPGS